MYEYTLNEYRGLIVRGGYATYEEARKEAEKEAAYLAENGLETTVSVQEEEE